MTVCAATKWKSNAEMILDIVELGYIRPTDRVIDLTFGGGKWWTLYQHPGLFWANLSPDDGLDEIPPYMDGWTCRDFREFGEILDHAVIENGGFDVTVFDPDYVSMGGRATSGMPEFMDRYGLRNSASTPELLQKDNERGLAEAMRITKPGGLILAKCAPYISSGVRKEGDWWARDAALAMGLTVHDMLIHVGNVRAQPKDGPCKKCRGTGEVVFTDPDGTIARWDQCMKCSGTGRIPREVKHARNNYSVLLILKKPKPPRTRKKATT